MNGIRSSGLVLAWILLAFVPNRPSTGAATAVDPAAATVESQASGVHRLTSIEATPAEEGVRVFLAADGPISARPSVLSSPDRLVLDLDNVQASLKTNRITVDSPSVVTRVRVGQHQEGDLPVARVVLDLNGAQPYTLKSQPRGLEVMVGGSGRPAQAESVGQEPASAAAVMPSSADRSAADSWTAASADAEELPIGRESASAAAPAAAVATMERSSSAQTTPSASAHGSSPSSAQTTTSSAPSHGSSPAAGKSQGVARVAPSGVTSLAPGMAAPVAGAESEYAQTHRAPQKGGEGATYEAQKITDAGNNYTGKKVSLNLVDADIKQVFRLFHEISGLNFVLDPSVAGNVTIVLDEVPWDQALDIILKNNGLDKVYEDNVIRIATTQKLAQEASGRKALKEAKELEVEPVTITRRLSYAKAKEVDQIIRTGVLLSQRGKSFFDDRTNTLIVTDVPTKIEPLDRLMTALDEKTPQVMIEARIVLTGRDFIQDLGIDWGFTHLNGPNGPNFPNNGEVTYNLTLPRAAATNRLAFNLFNRSGSFNLNIALDALETDGKSRTISAPKIATQNNVKAEIEQGVQIPYSSSTATEVNVQFIAASLKLSVTPQITAEGTVIMDITVENNQPSKTVNIGGSIPGIDTQRAQTKVMVDDGGTTVIGGIFSVSESESESGVPWFRKIPVFGWLFKSRNITTQNRELLIFITPKILRTL